MVTYNCGISFKYGDWQGKYYLRKPNGNLQRPEDLKIKYPCGYQAIGNSFDKVNFWQGFFLYRNDKKGGVEITAPVKSYPPNTFGYYDMADNV
ncbi:MAG: SUMF1/EgtB/PvdO family nonheme iron enzyme [Candidatus Cyclobacteriaceae bacterium M2_1C_046]